MSDWMRKTQKTRPVADQFRIASWAHEWLEAEGGPLFAPAVRAEETWSYEIEVVETDEEPWFLTAVPDHMRHSVWRFVCAAEREGFELNDCEFLLQSDGRVAVIGWSRCACSVHG